MTTPHKDRSRPTKFRPAIVFVLLFAAAPIVRAYLPDDSAPRAEEVRAVRALNAAKALGEPGVYAFLRAMPKGGDLHMHLSGAIYAETFLKDAAADGLCVDLRALSFAKNAGTSKDTSSTAKCPAGTVAAATVLTNQKLYDALIDAFSMRGFVPTPGVSGHDQFFATFDRFSGIDKSHTGEWLDEVATRAAAQNEQYLEVMQTPSFFELAPLWNKLGWPSTAADARLDAAGDTTGTSPAELSALRMQLLAGGLRDQVNLDIRQLDDALTARKRIERCGEASAASACSVQIRYLYQVLRAFPPQQVFAQTLLAFEVASADPSVVGLNFVQPEDATVAMSEYNRQMHMLDYLHSVYPQVHISLHAGELALGMVPPEGLTFHIREAVELGHAERIGHGVDVMRETDARTLIQELANRHVMVEINLTSNQGILGIEGRRHPLAAYRAAHVPVALSTDDEGVSRIDLTHEYARAVEDQGLGYLDLKRMARTSLEHSFLPGASLWQKPDVFTRVHTACAGQRPGVVTPSSECGTLLKSSAKAAEQWELERRFAMFEASIR